jgi:hypothetical protein
LDIVGQNSRGTNKFSSVKQMVRFLKLLVGDKASTKIYSFIEAYPLERSLSRMSTPKKIRNPEAHPIEEVDQDGARLSCFCVVLFTSLSHRKNRTIKRGLANVLRRF